MPTATPTTPQERTALVDVIRGFALTGVLFANFNSYVEQQIPESVLQAIATPADTTLANFNAIFLEWKFMTLFSILFGYGFGLILESLARKQINPTAFFLRRMFWLFVFGVFHSLFWWADVLHLYAVTGVLLLLFRRQSNGAVLMWSIICMFILPTIISFAFRNQPETFIPADIEALYQTYRTGDLFSVIRFNLDFYYRMFIVSGSDVHDIIETLGRFLFGYFLVRIQLFSSVENKKGLFRTMAMSAMPLMLGYFMLKWLLIQDAVDINEYIRAPLLSIGILATTTLYVSLLVLVYIQVGKVGLFKIWEALGRMTLTNYLLVSACLIVLLYGLGFGQIGKVNLHMIWLYAVIWLVIEILFSTWWLGRFRYGPMEWIWRQLTYGKRLVLRK